MTYETTVLLDGLGFPEGPRWHAGRLWFSDFESRLVSAVDLQGNVEAIVEVPGMPSGLGWLPDGRLLVVAGEERRLLRLDPEGLTTVADLSGLASYTCNDMVVDAQGRAYIGNFGWDWADPAATPKLAEVVLVLPTGEARVVATDMAFPNGSVITPEGKTLIVAETYAARLSAFDIAADGSLSNRRTWAGFDDLGFGWHGRRVRPDGICLDTEGAVWVALLSPGEVHEVVRVREGGEISDRIQSDRLALAPMLGGPDRRTLFVTSVLGISFRNEAPLSGTGRIETVRVPVPGAGLP